MTRNDVAVAMGLEAVPVDDAMKIGVALGTLGQVPINGLRHLPTANTSGWYVWAGEVLDPAPDFFSPLHVSHLADLLPEVLPYLSLPPGYRSLLARDYEDVWFDLALLVD